VELLTLSALLRRTSFSEEEREILEDYIEHEIKTKEEYYEMYRYIEAHLLSIRDGPSYGQHDILNFLNFRFGKKKKGFKFI